MIRHANVVKEAVQLANAVVDLLGEVAGVHGEQNQPPLGDSSAAKYAVNRRLERKKPPSPRWCWDVRQRRVWQTVKGKPCQGKRRENARGLVLL